MYRPLWFLRKYEIELENRKASKKMIKKAIEEAWISYDKRMEKRKQKNKS